MGDCLDGGGFKIQMTPRNTPHTTYYIDTLYEPLQDELYLGIDIRTFMMQWHVNLLILHIHDQQVVR